MVTFQQILDTQQEIQKNFLEECENGQQSADLKQNNAMACGQFMGKNARSIVQRGLHGTAAAIRVLSGSNESKYKSIVGKLLNYLINREQDDKSLDVERLNLDKNDVIKLSETLSSLTKLGISLSGIQEHANKIAENLLLSKKNKGWSFYLDSNFNDPEILPTAFAFLALTKYGSSSEKLEDTLNYLNNYIKNNILNPTKTTIIDFSVDIFCLYSLVFRGDFSSYSKEDKKLYRDAFIFYWNKSSKIFYDNFEQNLEYWNNDLSKSKYIRIPWQLYLIGLSTKIDLLFFFRNDIQNKLDRIITQVMNGGFIYPHSGNLISTRTNSILYEILDLCKEPIQRPGFYLLWYYIESMVAHLRRFLESKISQFFINIFGIVIIVFSIFNLLDIINLNTLKFLGEEKAKTASYFFKSLAPNFISPVVIFFYFLGRRNKP